MRDKMDVDFHVVMAEKYERSARVALSLISKARGRRERERLRNLAATERALAAVHRAAAYPLNERD